MLIFNKIANIVLVSGALYVVWLLVKAAKIVATPPPNETQSVLSAVKRLHALVEKMIFQMGEVSGVNDPTPTDEAN